MSIKAKTGQKAPVSGQYTARGSKTEITMVEGKRVPPTKNGSSTFTLVDKTKHKGATNEISRCSSKRTRDNLWYSCC